MLRQLNETCLAIRSSRSIGRSRTRLNGMFISRIRRGKHITEVLRRYYECITGWFVSSLKQGNFFTSAVAEDDMVSAIMKALSENLYDLQRNDKREREHEN